MSSAAAQYRRALLENAAYYLNGFIFKDVGERPGNIAIDLSIGRHKPVARKGRGGNSQVAACRKRPSHCAPVPDPRSGKSRPPVPFPRLLPRRCPYWKAAAASDCSSGVACAVDFNAAVRIDMHAARRGIRRKPRRRFRLHKRVPAGRNFPEHRIAAAVRALGIRPRALLPELIDRAGQRARVRSIQADVELKRAWAEHVEVFRRRAGYGHFSRR